MGSKSLLVVVIVVLCGLAVSGIAFAEVPDQLTLEEAIELALENSHELESARYDTEIAEVTKDEVWEEYNVLLMETYIPGTDLHVSVPSDVDFEEQVYATNFQWLVKQKNEEMKKDSIAVAVIKKYYEILQAMKEVETKRLAAERDAKKLDVTCAKFQVGMVTSASLSRCQAEYLASLAALKAAEDNLDKLYKEFNELLGLPIDSRPQLVDVPKYDPLAIEDPEQVISDIVAESPVVWIADETVRYYRQTMGMNEFSSYELDKAEINKALADAELAREKMRQSTRKIYVDLKGLEENYQAAVEGLNTARKTFENVRMFCEVGMATEAELNEAKAAVAKAEADLFKLICNHEILKSVFYKPWTAEVLLKQEGSVSTSSSSQESGSSGMSGM